MGTPTLVQWTLLLLSIGALLLFAPGALAGPQADASYVAGAPVVDGLLDDAFWEDATTHLLSADGTLDSASHRDVELRAAHNGTHLFLAVSFKPGGGTHEGDFVLVTFDPAIAGDARGARDLFRYGWPVENPLLDRTWDGQGWVDDSSKGCSLDGEAARKATNGSWIFELVRPLHGDDCDLQAQPGDGFGFRVEVRENLPAPDHGDNHRWPVGTTYRDGDTSDWGTLRLEVIGGASGEAGAGDKGDESGDTDDTNDSGSLAEKRKGGALNSGEGPGASGGPSDDAQEAPAPAIFLALFVFAAAALRAGGRR